MLAERVQGGGRAAIRPARQIHTAAMQVHAEPPGQPQATGGGSGQGVEGRLQGQLGLAADAGAHQALGHRPHLDHQAAGPPLHQKSGLGGIGLVQIHRQPQSRLDAGRQGQIRWPAAVHHQGIAHGAGGAVQIEGHAAGGGAAGAMGRQQRAGPQDLPLLAAGIGEQLRGKAAVEVAVEVAAVEGQGLGVADLQLQLHTIAAQQLRLLPPLLQQPGGIALVAMGGGHHQHPPLRHLRPAPCRQLRQRNSCQAGAGSGSS